LKVFIWIRKRWMTHVLRWYDERNSEFIHAVKFPSPVLLVIWWSRFTGIRWKYRHSKHLP